MMLARTRSVQSMGAVAHSVSPDIK